MNKVQDKLQEDLERLIDAYVLTGASYADIIGTLEIVKLNLWKEGQDDEDDNSDYRLN
jgi:hypothetical protein